MTGEFRNWRRRGEEVTRTEGWMESGVTYQYGTVMVIDVEEKVE